MSEALIWRPLKALRFPGAQAIGLEIPELDVVLAQP